MIQRSSAGVSPASMLIPAAFALDKNGPKTEQTTIAQQQNLFILLSLLPI
jgi:hypothetical protein